MTMNLKPALRYQLKDYLLSGGILLAVNLFFIAAVGFGLFAFGDRSAAVSFTGYGFICAIFMFVFGIAIPRQSMRLNIQLGVSRRTTFLAALLSTAAASLGLAVCGEVLISVAQTLALPMKNCIFSDLYAMIYQDMAKHLTLGQHLTSILFSACLLFCAWTAGCFLTFLYWRVSTVGTVLVSVAIPVIIWVVPGLLYYFRRFFQPVLNALTQLGEWFLASPWFAMGLFLAFAACFALLAWLLVRKANIRGTAHK